MADASRNRNTLPFVPWRRPASSLPRYSASGSELVSSQPTAVCVRSTSGVVTLPWEMNRSGWPARPKRMEVGSFLILGQGGMPKHSGSLQSISPLQLSSIMLLQISFGRHVVVVVEVVVEVDVDEDEDDDVELDELVVVEVEDVLLVEVEDELVVEVDEVVLD